MAYADLDDHNKLESIVRWKAATFDEGTKTNAIEFYARSFFQGVSDSTAETANTARETQRVAAETEFLALDEGIQSTYLP